MPVFSCRCVSLVVMSGTKYLNFLHGIKMKKMLSVLFRSSLNQNTSLDSMESRGYTYIAE